MATWSARSYGTSYHCLYKVFPLIPLLASHNYNLIKSSLKHSTKQLELPLCISLESNPYIQDTLLLDVSQKQYSTKLALAAVWYWYCGILQCAVGCDVKMVLWSDWQWGMVQQIVNSQSARIENNEMMWDGTYKVHDVCIPSNKAKIGPIITYNIWITCQYVK